MVSRNCGNNSVWFTAWAVQSTGLRGAQKDISDRRCACAASGIGEFRVVDPPRASQEAVFPNRPVLLAVLLALSIGAGAGAAILRDQLRPTYFDLRGLRASTGLPVFGTVSMIIDAAGQARARRGVIVFSGSAVIYLALFAALLAWAWLRQPMR